MKTIAKISEETLTIINYIEEIPSGTILTFKEIEKATGVKMDLAGKTYLRTACKKQKRLYSAIIGSGIKLIDESDASTLLVKKTRAIDSRVKDAEKAQKIIMSDFYDKLPEREQKQVLFLGAVFGAIRVSAESGTKYLKNATRKEPIAPMLPENINKQTK